MLTVALVASLAAASLWQQWRSVEIESAERTRIQAQWVLTGALDWARLILREDARSGGADHLAEPWSVPLEEARLSTFLATDKSSPVDADSMTETFLSGRITDLQSRLNLRNLVDSGRVSEPAYQAFAKLFEKLQLPVSELTALAENLRFALDTSPDNRSSPLSPLMPQRLSQLGWLGLSARSMALLQPYITLLPVATPVNLNTADALVLYACIASADMALAQRMVSARQTSHFRTLGDAAKLVGDPPSQLVDAQHSVVSRFFEVHGILRQDQVIVEQRSVLQRDAMAVVTLWKDGGPEWEPAKPLK
ncbi:MAG: type II secretion system minor pseudopilin GspK [Rhodoferax sp.]|nr:type II secretion system minor pseudopilin GspK [Rhodoferax sp.]MCF8208350.1 type II secretion system minor pseudopilin GspK [Rhodoferax sp.]